MTVLPARTTRRILVAVVTGSLGDTIQAWRQEHDPKQARRLPPHATLCYQTPPIENAAALDRQIRHAFPTQIAVALGGVHEFTNRDGTFFIEVSDADALNAARTRLFDATFCTLDGQQDFTWHVTCVRYPEEAKREALRSSARELAATIAESPIWTIDAIAWLELRDGVYEPLHTWTLPATPLPLH